MMNFLKEHASHLGYSFSICNIDKVRKYITGGTNEQPLYWLTPGEQRQLSRYRLPERRTEWLCGRLALKTAVYKYFRNKDREIDIARIEICYDENRAPYVNMPGGPEISLTHSYSYAVAVAADQTIGIDLEKIGRRSLAPLHNYFYSQSEKERIMQCNEPVDKQTLTTIYWTRKEAVSKVYKIGGRLNFKTINTTADVIHDHEKENRYIRLFSSYNDEYCITIAVFDTKDS